MVCPEPEQPSMADECCGSLECHCIEGYSRFIDHKGKNYDSYHMSHIEFVILRFFHIATQVIIQLKANQNVLKVGPAQ